MSSDSTRCPPTCPAGGAQTQVTTSVFLLDNLTIEFQTDFLSRCFTFLGTHLIHLYFYLKVKLFILFKSVFFPAEKTAFGV